MILSHFSPNPLKFNPNQEYSHREGFHKPSGFWLSDEFTTDGWKDWCKGNDFRVGHLKHETLFYVDPRKYLWLKTVHDLDDFSAQYEKELGDTGPKGINWERVMHDHKGLIITPYQYARRLTGPIWYYSWDCASACIWDLEGVKVYEQGV